MAIYSPEDWYYLSNAFRWSQEARRSVLGGNTEEALLEQVILSLLTDKSETLKVHLLVFLQENAAVLLSDSKRLNEVCAALDTILNSPVDGSSITHHLRSQILVTTTTVLIETSATQTQPGLFESFVEVLHDFISKVNESGNRVVRQMACECLRELELTYPGLLSSSLGDLLVYAMEECTHAAQSYMQLFVTVLHHTINQLMAERDTGNALELSAPGPHPPVIYARRAGETARDQLSGALLKKIRRATLFVLENGHLLTEWGLLYLVPRLVHFHRFLALPPPVFKTEFFGFLFTNHPVLWHVVLLLMQEFPDIFDPEDIQVAVQRLLAVMKDPHTLLPQRILAIKCLMALASRDPQSPVCIQRWYRELYPQVFDPLDLMDAKLDALCHCFVPGSEEWGPPPSLFEVLACMQSFRYYAPGSRPASIVFTTLFHFLSKFSDILFIPARDFLVHTAMESPQFLGNIIALIDRLAKHCPDSRVPALLLSSFNEFLIALEPPARLKKYFTIVDRIVQEPAIQPSNMIRAVLRFLNSPHACRGGNWKVGHQILCICRTCLKYHPTPVIFRPLCEILTFLASFYGDVDIRDRAHFYYQLLTHVSGDKLMQILAGPSIGKLPGSVMVDFVTPAHRRPRIIHANKFNFLKLVRLERLPPPVKREPAEEVENLSFDEADQQDDAYVKGDEDSLALDDPTLPQLPDRSESLESSESSRLLLSYYLSINKNTWKPYIRLGFRLQYAHALKVHLSDANGREKGEGGHEPPHGAASMCPNKVYALQLQFSSSPYYAPIPSVRLPYLSKHPENTVPDRFPFMFNLVLSVRPMMPVPTSFDVNIVFNDDEGKTCSGMLEPISVLFDDLFLPVTFPGHLRQEFPRSRAHLLVRLFNAMWIRAALPNLGIPAAHEIPRMEGSASVKTLDITRESMLRVLEKEMEAFLVKDDDSDGEDDSTSNMELLQEEPVEGSLPAICAIVFLPPRYHLLLKFFVCEYFTVIRIRTDHWRSLAYLDNFFAGVVRRACA